MDRDAEVDEKSTSWVRHSKCGNKYKVKRPYDRSRFGQHVNNECAHTKRAAGTGTPMVSQWQKSFNLTLEAKTQQPRFACPCPGLWTLDDSQIAIYLDRTGAPGGGARSVTAIAKERFKKMFQKLSPKRKEEIFDAQVHEHKWQNDHQREHVYSTNCLQEVVTTSASEDERVLPCSNCTGLFRNHNFRQALNRPRLKDKHYVFINKRWRPPKKIAELYGRIHGLREIIETAVSLI